MYQEVKLKVTLENISKLKNPQNVQDTSTTANLATRQLVTIKQDKPVFHCMT